jgi:hypothetical protein
MCTAGLFYSTTSPPSDKEPSSILQLRHRSCRNILGRRMGQNPVATAHLLVALCNLFPPHVGYLG